MYLDEDGDIVIDIAKIKEAFIKGRCELGYEDKSIKFDDDDFRVDFWSTYFINDKKLEELGLDKSHSASICLNLVVKGDSTDTSDVDNPHIVYTDEGEMGGLESTGIKFITMSDGEECEADDYDAFTALTEQFHPTNARNFWTEFEKIYDKSYFYDDPIWVAKHSEFEDGFNQWLYTDEDQRTIIQIVLDRCKETGQDLTPGDFKDWGLEFETDNYDIASDAYDTTTVAQYIIDNEIDALSGWAEEYIEEQEALEEAKNRKSSGRSR